MSLPIKRLYEFGPFRLNVGERLLLRGEEVVQLTPKVFDLLLALVENSGHTVEKDELMRRVWSDSFVEEANLSRNIFTLRKALGEDTDEQRYIETVPRRGYRFVASVRSWPVEPADSADLVVAERARSRIVIEQEDETGRTEVDVSARRRLRALPLAAGVAIFGFGLVIYWWLAVKAKPESARLGKKSIAVLPFKPLVAENRDEALELGMAETLITGLSNLREVIVRPISSVRKYTDLQQDAVAAGRELQVESVLEASIQKSGDRLRVVARLVKIKDGTQLWSDKFDEKFTDIFAVQDRISERITTALALTLTGEKRKLLSKRYTDNTAAYQLYMKGRYFWGKFTEDGLRKSIGLFEQAIEKDPDYALAYTGLAASYMVLGVNGHMSPQAARPKTKYAIEKALELDNNLAWGRQSLGAFKLFHEWDWAAAEREFKLAIELDPSLAETHELYSYLLSELGRFDEALAELKKAQELDPVSVLVGGDYGDTLRLARRYDQAIEALNKMLEMDPSNGFLHYSLGLASAQKGMSEKAVTEMNKAVSLFEGSTRMMSGLGQVYALSGNNAEARKVIAELLEVSQQRYVSPLYIAMIYATLGENDQAFSWLEMAYADHSCWLIELKIEPAWDNLRFDPRFTNLMHRVGLAN